MDDPEITGWSDQVLNRALLHADDLMNLLHVAVMVARGCYQSITNASGTVHPKSRTAHNALQPCGVNLMAFE